MGTRSMVFLDWAMIFHLCKPENFEILEGFLSELIHRNVKIRHIVKSKRIDNKYSNFNEVEILAELENREISVLEMQYGGFANYFFRERNGATISFSEYIHRGDLYKEVNSIYSINITYFDFEAGDDYIYYGSNSLKGLHTNNELCLGRFFKQLCCKRVTDEYSPQYYIINPAKIENKVPENALDEWVFYLYFNKIKDSFTAKGMDKARQTLLFGALTDEEQSQYHRFLDNLRTYDGVLMTAFNEGRQKAQL